MQDARNENSEGVDSPGAYVDDYVSRCQFCLSPCPFGRPFRALVDYHLGSGEIQLRDAVG